MNVRSLHQIKSNKIRGPAQHLERSAHSPITLELFMIVYGQAKFVVWIASAAVSLCINANRRTSPSSLF